MLLSKHRRVLALAVSMLCITSASRTAPSDSPGTRPFQFRAKTLTPRYIGSVHVTAGAIPTGLAKGDFNEDGSPDAVAAYATGASGVAAIYRGNPAWLYGTGAAGPFFEETTAIALPARPDFIAAGDFNGDRHHDLVIATRGEPAAYWLPGQGDGTFGKALEIELGSPLTAFAAGDFGREDGVPDVAFGTGNRIAIHESLRGGVKADPYEIVTGEEVHSLAIGHLDAAEGGDIAIAAGHSAWTLSGDDYGTPLQARAPKLDPWRGAEIAGFVQEPSLHGPGRIAARPRGAKGGHPDVFATEGIAVSDAPVATLAMRLNYDAKPDYVYLTASGAVVTVSSETPGLIIDSGFVNHGGDESDADLNDGVCDIGPPSRPTGLCSLRAAIQNANAGGGGNITFGVNQIVLRSGLPQIMNRVIIDGGANKVEITGAPGYSGVGFFLGPNTGFSVIRNVVMNNIDTAMVIAGGNTIVEGCLIGTNRAGTGAVGITNRGILISSNSNQIGGTAGGARNLITTNQDGSSNGLGIVVQGSFNKIENNYIGANITGTGKVGNPVIGVIVNDSPANFTGGLDPGAGNLIVGTVDGSRPFDFTYTGVGVYIYSFNTQATANRIQGNYIGVAADGKTPVPHFRDGIFSAGFNAIVQNNLVSGNGRNGIVMDGPGYLVLSNFIGTDSTGKLPVANAQDGISATGRAPSTRIGGPDQRNVISGNGRHGISVSTPENVLNIVNNYIGVSVTGMSKLANGGNGIDGTGAANIGNSVEGGNVISGNLGTGINLNFTVGAGPQVKSNLIGLAADGVTPIGNGGAGVIINGRGTIGGTVAADRNVISANADAGVATAQGGGLIHGNFIGTDAAGLQDRGNIKEGVRIESSATLAVGGLAPGQGNRIAFNNGSGIHRKTRGNSIYLSNEIFSNEALGIDTSVGSSADGPNPQTDGFNNLVNSPVLNTVSVAGGNTSINGRFAAPMQPGTPVLFQFFSSPACDPSGFGEGRTLLATQTFNAQSLGQLSFNASIPAPAPAGHFVTATATMGAVTQPEQNDTVTSEFSECKLVPGPPCGANISAQVQVTRGGFRLDRTKNRFIQTVTLTNISGATIGGAISLALDGLSPNAQLFTRNGITACSSPASPYQDAVPAGSSLAAVASVAAVLEFTNPTNAAIYYSTRVLGAGSR